MERQEATLQTRGVLAGAYKGTDSRLGLTHAVYAVGMAEGEALCGRVKRGHMADGYASDPSEEPTCKRCRSIWQQRKLAERMFPCPR